MHERWIVVPHWDRFQHYGNRELLWIKVYLSLRNHPEWRALTLGQRGLQTSLWLEYAASKGQLRSSELSSLILQKVPRKSLEALIHAGFIELSASKPSRARASARSLEEEAEPSALQREEKETPYIPLTAKTDDYQRAENFVRNAGWQLTDYAYAEEIERRFRLDLDELTALDAIRTQLANQPTEEDPF